MAKRKSLNTNNKIEPDFIEEEFICAINSQLITMSKQGLFANKTISRISQQDENDRGYDGYLNTLVPFFIQFKRSVLYNHKYKGDLFNGRSTAGHNNENGFYGFKVYKSPSDKYKQHNLLFSLKQSGQKCAYVAPLFHKAADLDDLKLNRNGLPWSIEDSDLLDLITGHVIKSYNMRFFKNSITIVPHQFIPNTDPSHHYTYRRDGSYACFHSKVQKLNSDPVLFTDFLDEIVTSESENPENLTSNIIRWFIKSMTLNLENQDKGRTSSKYLRILVAEEISSILDKKVSEKSAPAQFEKLSMFKQLTLIEKILREEFQIHQYFAFEKN